MSGYGCISLVLWAGCLCAHVSGESPDEQRFRKFVAQSLVLNCEPNCPHRQFQFDAQFRRSNVSGVLTDIRAAAQRHDDKATVLFLSPQGIPSTIVADSRFYVIDDGAFHIFNGGRFRFRAGLPDGNASGIAIALKPDTESKSTITLDLNAVVNVFALKGTTFVWEAHNRQGQRALCTSLAG